MSNKYTSVKIGGLEFLGFHYYGCSLGLVIFLFFPFYSFPPLFRFIILNYYLIVLLHFIYILFYCFIISLSFLSISDLA